MFRLNQIFTVSNLISFFRLLLAVPFWFLLDYLHSGDIRYYIFALCLFASGTDILDGFLARKLNQVTEFGKIIDPLADKVAIGVIVIKLFLIGEIPLYYFIIILSRDILIFIGGILLSVKLGKVVPSNALGKITVIVIGIVILLIILQVNREEILFAFFYGLSLILTVSSLTAYTLGALELLNKKNYESV